MTDIANENTAGKVLNTQTLTGLIGEDDPALIRKFQVDFLKQAKESMAKIVALFKNNQLSQIKEEAHFLKTSAKAIGAEQVGFLLEAMEKIALEGNSDKCRQQIVQINDGVKKVYEAIINEK